MHHRRGLTERRCLLQLSHTLGHACGVVRVLEDRMGHGATWLIQASTDLIAEVAMRLVTSLH